MPTRISRTIPTIHLAKLNFLIGESSGIQTLYPPESTPVQFKAFVTGSWEACERFVKLDYFAEIPEIGIESYRSMITFNETDSQYRMWIFASSQEEPMHLRGDFKGKDLVFVSDPTTMLWGMQRLRLTFRSGYDGTVELLGERWEPDGYAKYCSVVFRHELDS